MENIKFNEKYKQFLWFDSQFEYHKNLSLENNWHKNQSKWYLKKRNGLFGLNVIIKNTIIKRTPQIIDSFIRNNPLVQRLRSKK